MSALLVFAMLCAMVPVAFAATTGDNRGTLKETIINEVFVGDTFYLPIADGCTGTVSVTCTKSDGTSLGSSSNYVKKNSDGTYSASKTTLTTNNSIPGGYIIAKVSGNEKSGCTHSKEYKIKIYSQATSISVKQTSVVVTPQQSVKLDVTLNPAGSVRNEIYCEPDVNGVAEATYNEVTKQVEIKYLKDGKSDLKLVVDHNTNHEKEVWITVSTNANAVVTIKKDKTEVAKTGKAGEDTVSVGDKMTLTATVTGATGTSSDVTWTSSNPNSVYVSRKGAVEALAVGDSIITATSNDTNATAEYKLHVIGAITGVTLKENNKEVKTKQVTEGDEAFTITATTAPAGSEGSVKWTVSDASVLTIADSTTGKTATSVTGASVKVTPKKAGKATLTATVGGKSSTVTVTVLEPMKTLKDVVKLANYSIRDGSDLLSRFQKKYPTIQAELADGSGAVEVPVTWLYSTKTADAKKIVITGRINETDENGYTQYQIDKNIATFDVNVALTSEGEVVSNVITASSTTAVENDKITLTCKAEAEPSDCKLSYQWYKDGTPISGATKSTYEFTVPESAKDSADTYKFTCSVTATRNGTSSTALESNTVTLNVSRDYAIELAFDNSKATYTVGQTPKVTATVYKYENGKKNAVSNPGSMSWELIDASTEKELDKKLATVSGSGSTATVTTKATEKAGGQKITVRMNIKLDGYTYSGTKEFTLNAASAGSVTMSVGTGSTIKTTTLKNKISSAVNSSDVTISYVKFDTPKNCSLTKGSNSSTVIGTTACYFSTTSGQKLSEVYVTLATKATSGSVTYTAYDNNDNVVATGTINFDDEQGGSITCLGISLDNVKTAVTDEFADTEYIQLETLDSKYGRLLLDYKGIIEIDNAKDVKSSDKIYLKSSSSVDSMGDVYLLPRTDYYGTISLKYTAYASGGKSLGDGTLSFSVVRKTSSSKFTDVTASNVGSWAADAIDFMADNNLVGGTGSGKFSPTNTMTRCDLVLILYRMAGQPTVTGVENIFTDVSSSDYYYKAVLWAYKNGVVTGTGAGTFSPKANITREQLAAILFRYSGASGASGSLASFADAGLVSSYATTAMKWAVGGGIIGGSNGKLNPQGNATRAEVAVMLHRFLNK